MFLKKSYKYFFILFFFTTFACMRLSIPGFLKPVWERDAKGENFYDISAYRQWTSDTSNLDIAENHPILTPALLFISKLYSQADFSIKNTRTKKTIEKHWMLDLLDNPNPYQTKEDFLEGLCFGMIAQGKAIVYMKKNIGFDEPENMFLINPDLIKWPDNFKISFTNKKDLKEIYGDLKIVYDEHGEDIRIKIKDLLFFYDLPNCLHKNPFENKSRLDGLKQTLINTKDSLLAKNIILKTNGKELISGKKDGFPLTPDEKEEAEKLFYSNYGLGANRKRGIITKASLTHQSLHIALRDLGLDESTKVDGNIIYTALHIPKDILSLEAKKTTYNNFKESMVSYIQNEIQTTLVAAMSVFQKEITEPNLRLNGNYEHLPVMQFILLERYKVAKERSLALKEARLAGLPDEIALKITGFDETIKLNEVSNGKEEKEKQSNDEGD